MTSQSELFFNYCPTGGGAVVGPFFIRNRPFNVAEYLRLLREEVFPTIHWYLGDRRWNEAMWMQVLTWQLLNFSEPY